MNEQKRCTTRGLGRAEQIDTVAVIAWWLVALGGLLI
jgi:hypothetical protein